MRKFFPDDRAVSRNAFTPSLSRCACSAVSKKRVRKNLTALPCTLEVLGKPSNIGECAGSTNNAPTLPCSRKYASSKTTWSPWLNGFPASAFSMLASAGTSWFGSSLLIAMKMCGPFDPSVLIAWSGGSEISLKQPKRWGFSRCAVLFISNICTSPVEGRCSNNMKRISFSS